MSWLGLKIMAFDFIAMAGLPGTCGEIYMTEWDMIFLTERTWQLSLSPML